jgi:polygalacturonase
MLRLKSHVTLFVDPTAVLEASPDLADFPAQNPPTHNVNLTTCRRAMLYAQGATDVTIDGGGTIEGNGNLPQYALRLTKTERSRPIMFWAVQTSHIALRNVTFHDGAVWGIVPMESSDVTIDNVYVDSTSGLNRDGIDVVDSSGVTIEHSVFHTNDDAICPKSGVAAGVHGLTVRDTAVTRSGIANGLKFGAVSYGGFADSSFTDVLVKNVSKAGISIEAADGADVTNVTFERIEIDGAGAPLFMLVEDRGQTPSGSRAKVGSVDGVHFVDIRATNTRSSDGSPMVGLDQNGVRHPLQNLTFARVNLQYPGGRTTVPTAPAEPGSGYPEFNMFGALPAAGLYFRHVDGLTFENCRTTIAASDARPASAFVDVTEMAGSP